MTSSGRMLQPGRFSQVFISKYLSRRNDNSLLPLFVSASRPTITINRYHIGVLHQFFARYGGRLHI